MALLNLGREGLDLQLRSFDTIEARFYAADFAASLIRLSLNLTAEVSFACDFRPKLLDRLATKLSDLVLDLEEGVTFLHNHHLLLRIGELVKRNFEKVLGGLLKGLLRCQLLSRLLRTSGLAFELTGRNLRAL